MVAPIVRRWVLAPRLETFLHFYIVGRFSTHAEKPETVPHIFGNGESPLHLVCRLIWAAQNWFPTQGRKKGLH
jgi:hypothetical protein